MYRNLNFREPISHVWPPRKMMGLPEAYTRSSHDAGIAAAMRRLLGAGTGLLAELAGVVEDPGQTLHSRLAAGAVLALLGDPRIQPLSPAMVDICAPGPVMLGLAVEDLARACRDMAPLGVQPAWIEKECPMHAVALTPFRIARYPVTNHEFSLFLEDTGRPWLPTSWIFGRYPAEKGNHPVHTVDPEAADAYAAWLSAKTGRAFRLPTEAEWEFSAAGPDRLEFPWGNAPMEGVANTVELGLLDSSPVGCFPGGNSVHGVADMGGNVEEYVSDTYRPYPGGRVIIDDLYRISPDYRIARGGSYTRFLDLARTRRRHGRNPNSAVYAMGFRLAESL
ncbi:SUMF1/EgtB/PvdO family nonheme iron enzyme [Nitrosovibrio sp. Nv17]|jgi:formylglycine-generating enzyme required for sulfatase activity|uniref:formylglycine-generating enzyme family protein n=1 Tax=Nitrosovibrio sp. Nv17 TaxID=1855339 RepID=UPI0009085673|nr:SUMF1/EgtB/PvdO family nonheme iron enzyme [Nitrosovibrio sp. Nv17]SFW37401.1 Formylglycine-generating enzyme, required for sulfatase activity, contains SUMF1/FGE domain [Nitrosovibrio sp. Nv17]